MPPLFAFCKWLENSPVGTSVRESVWQFPVIETFHLFGIILLVGSSSVLDLRLMGLAFREEKVSKLAHRTLPWAWSGIGIEVVTGFLLFASEATRMAYNHAFQLKMTMLLLSGMNVFVFHNIAYKSVGTWEKDVLPPILARLAGLLSLLLWFAIVSAGMWTPYF